MKFSIFAVVAFAFATQFALAADSKTLVEMTESVLDTPGETVTFKIQSDGVVTGMGRARQPVTIATLSPSALDSLKAYISYVNPKQGLVDPAPMGAICGNAGISKVKIATASGELVIQSSSGCHVATNSSAQIIVDIAQSLFALAQ